jgi:hypothetical protein
LGGLIFFSGRITSGESVIALWIDDARRIAGALRLLGSFCTMAIADAHVHHVRARPRR